MTITTTTSTTTVSASGDSGESSIGLISSKDRSLISSSWERANKNGNIGPVILFT